MVTNPRTRAQPQALDSTLASARAASTRPLLRAIAAIMMANEAEVMQHLEGRDWEAYVVALRPRYAVRQAAALKRFARAQGLALAPLEIGLQAALPHVTALVNAGPEPRGGSIPACGPSCAHAVARGTLPDLADLMLGWPILQGPGLIKPREGQGRAPGWRRALLQIDALVVPGPRPMRAINPAQSELAHAA